MPLFDNVFINSSRYIQIHLVNFIFDQWLVHGVVETEVTLCDPFGLP